MRCFMIAGVLLFHVVYGTNEMCGVNPTELCNKDELSPSELPSDVLEFEHLCSKYVKYMDCLEVYERACPSGYVIAVFTPGDTERNFELLREMCDSSTRLHSAYSNHVGCIKSTVDAGYDECSEIAEISTDSYFAFLRKQLKENTLDVYTVREEYFVLPPCLVHVYTTSCLISRIEAACSSEAGRLAAEVVQRSSFIQQRCHSEDVSNLKSGFLNLLDDDSGESRSLKTILQ